MTKKIINSADSDLFRQSVGEVAKIKSDKITLKQVTSPKPFPKAKTTQVTDDWQRTIGVELEHVSHEQTINFTAPGIQKSVLAKLRKGFFGIQAETDLHGLSAEAAKQQLLRVIHNSILAGHRCIHVIHGKGYRSNESHPILKNHINRWLREHKDVQAFCSASARQGGAGAVWVLLRLSNLNHEKYDD